MSNRVIVLVAALGIAAGTASASETAQPVSPPDVAAQPLMVERVKELDTLLERIKGSDDRAERSRLVQEYRNKMYENVAMMGQLMARRIAGSPGAPAQTRQPGPRGVTGPYGIMGSGPGFGRGYYPPMGPGAMLGSHPREMTGQRGQRRHGPGHRGHGMGGHGMGGARSKDHHQRMEEQLAKIANLLERLIQLQEARSRAQ